MQMATLSLPALTVSTLPRVLLLQVADGTVAVVLAYQPLPPVVSVAADATVQAVIATFKQHGISQAPVIAPTGELLGVVTEADLLEQALLRSDGQGFHEPVGRVVENAVAIVIPSTPLHSLLRAWAGGQTVVVFSAGHLAGVLTPIDVLHYWVGSDPAG
jgi:predicted transcriptional regulator